MSGVEEANAWWRRTFPNISSSSTVTSLTDFNLANTGLPELEELNFLSFMVNKVTDSPCGRSFREVETEVEIEGKAVTEDEGEKEETDEEIFEDVDTDIIN